MRSMAGISSRALAGMVAVAALFAQPAATQPADDRATCEKASEDVAIAACSRAIASGKYKGRDLAELYNHRGFERGAKRDLDRAIADYSEAIKLYPSYAVAYNNRGFAYVSKQDYDRAIADFSQAIKLDPKYAAAFYNRGAAYSVRNEYDRAIADFSAAIQLEPNFAAAFYNRGTAYAAKNEYDSAIVDFNEAIRLNPKLASAYNNRGFAFMGQKDYDRAIADYSEAVKLDPRYASAFHNRGLAYAGKNDYDSAIADYSEAIGLDPKFSAAIRNRGLAYYYNGNFSGAAADLVHASNDTHAMLWRFLARGRSGQDGSAELSGTAGRLKTKDWPYPVIDFYLGRRKLEEIFAAASRPEEKCQAAFYIGQWHLLRGNKVQAKTVLQTAVDTCPAHFAEYAGAVAEMKRLAP
jgi:lipoprotein NlpI